MKMNLSFNFDLMWYLNVENITNTQYVIFGVLLPDIDCERF